MYQDYFFRFPDELTAEQALVALYASVPATNVDRVGVIHAVSGLVPLPGWHVNVRVPEGSVIPCEMADFQIEAPRTPKRVWA